jgi:hypothetical protein
MTARIEGPESRRDESLARLGGPFRVLEIFELARRLEPQGAGRAGGDRLHGLVEHVQFARNDAADGATMGEPFGGVAGGQTVTFGGAVVFEDDRPTIRSSLP